MWKRHGRDFCQRSDRRKYYGRNQFAPALNKYCSSPPSGVRIHSIPLPRRDRPLMWLFWHFSPRTGGLLLVRGSRGPSAICNTNRTLGRKPIARTGASDRAGVGGWTKGQDWCPTCPIVQVILKGSKPVGEVPTLRATSARIDACTVKMRGEECGDLRFF